MDENNLINSPYYSRLRDILRTRTGFILRDENLNITVAKIEAQMDAEGFRNIDEYLQVALDGGDEKRLEFTVIGPAVNLVSRIDAHSKGLEPDRLLIATNAPVSMTGASNSVMGSR